MKSLIQIFVKLDGWNKNFNCSGARKQLRHNIKN